MKPVLNSTTLILTNSTHCQQLVHLHYYLFIIFIIIIIYQQYYIFEVLFFKTCIINQMCLYSSMNKEAMYFFFFFAVVLDDLSYPGEGSQALEFRVRGSWTEMRSCLLPSNLRSSFVRVFSGKMCLNPLSLLLNQRLCNVEFLYAVAGIVLNHLAFFLSCLPLSSYKKQKQSFQILTLPFTSDQQMTIGQFCS